MDKRLLCGCSLEQEAWNDHFTGKLRYCPLHAAAPALLEALEAAVSTLETCDAPETANEGDLQFWLERQYHAITQARAAIAQAKGETANGS